MSANQCNRWNLPAPQIPVSYSVCSLQTPGASSSIDFYGAVKKCCTTPITLYQCWNYCAVEDSEFSVWLDCIEGEIGSKVGAACQSAEQSSVSSTTTPTSTSTLSHTSTPSPTSTTTSTSTLSSTSTPPTYTPSLTARTSWGLNGTAIWLSPTGGSNGNNSTPAGIIPVTGGSAKALALSMSGIMCAFLALSTLAL